MGRKRKMFWNHVRYERENWERLRTEAIYDRGRFSVILQYMSGVMAGISAST